MKNSSKKKVPYRVITERDYSIFKSLWKWRALSTQAIAKKFFPDATPYSAYIRLVRLEESEYIESVQVGKPGLEVWTLAPRGFRVIKPRMVELAKDGFKSEHYPHDYLATAFHLGEWLTGQPEGAETFSEQQLLRIPEDLWPAWVPQSSLHRPDGYSLFHQKNKTYTVAFETELSPKSMTRYERHVTFYDSQESIEFVFWLVKSKGMVGSIKRAFEKYQVRQFPKHHFITLPDFREKGWMAPFIEGRWKGHNVGVFLSYNTATIPLHSRYACSTLALLDIRKRPIIPALSKSAEKLEIIV